MHDAARRLVDDLDTSVVLKKAFGVSFARGEIDAGQAYLIPRVIIDPATKDVHRRSSGGPDDPPAARLLSNHKKRTPWACFSQKT